MTGIILTLLGSVIGGVLASLIAIFIWEWHRQPKLAIEIPDKILGGRTCNSAIKSNL